MADPMTLFTSIATQLKAATDIAIGLGKLHTLAEVNAKAIELQSAILQLQGDAFTAHAQQSTMVQRIGDLEKEIARVKAWEETKQRYNLITPWAGSAVYALKEVCKTAEPAHWICTKCYEDGRKSILNPRADSKGSWFYACPVCKSEVHSPWRSASPMRYAEEYQQSQ